MLKLINVEFYKLMRRWLPYVMLAVLILMLVIAKASSYSGYSSFMSQHPGVEIPHGATSVTITSIIPDSVTDTNPSGVITSIETIYVGQWQEQLVLPDAMDSVLSTISGLGVILVIILAAQVVGTEYGWGTIRQTLIKGVSRRNFLIAKFLTLAIVIIAGVLITVLVGFLIGMLTTALVEGGIDWSFMTWGYLGGLLADIGRILLVLGIYLALTVLLCVLLRSAGTGMAVGLGVYFADSILAGLTSITSGFLKELFRFGIGYNVQQFTTSSTTQIMGEVIRPLWQSSGILLAWGVLFVVAAFYFLRRQDLTA
jgi:ABC-2 type transport system permease protein